MARRGRKPDLHVDASELRDVGDGFTEIPEAVYLANTLRVFEEQFTADGNPLWAWRAMNEIEAYTSRGVDAELPQWVIGQLFVAARRLLTLDPESVPKDKMPHAITDALGLTRKGGGPGYLASWHKRMDALVETMRQEPPIPEDAAAELRQKVADARAMPSTKQSLLTEISRRTRGARRNS